MSLVTYTVMYDKGEDIAGKNIRPYETFKAEPTPELNEKVEKGWLTTSSNKPPAKLRRNRK